MIKDRPRILLVNRGAVVYRNKLLLIKRAPNDDHFPNLWEFPGGKLDKGQDLHHALEREVLEETGLLVQPTMYSSYVESETLTEGKYKGLPYVMIVGIAKMIGGKLKLSKEHSEYKWVNLEEAYDMELTINTRKAISAMEKELRNLLTDEIF